MHNYNKVLDFLLIGVITFHLLISPYTKVEESFNIQAVHDILNYGIFPKSTIIDNYDHIEFPGVVPRTFIGGLMIAGPVRVFVYVLSLFGLDILSSTSQMQLLLLSRGVLGLSNALGLMQLRDSINKITRRRYGGLIGFWFMVFVLSSFHLLYYASRTLPNFIALPFVTFGLAQILEGDLRGLMLLSFTGIVFRTEVGVFAVIIAIVSSLGFGATSIVMNAGLIGTAVFFGGLLSFVVDSYFWNRPVLPELESFIFNIIDGKSVEWGVEPWSAYFTNYLPKLALPSYGLLALMGLVSDPSEDTENESKETINPARNSLRILVVSSYLFVAAMSFQPHKEWRFIIYVLPVLLLSTASLVASLCKRFSKSLAYKIIVLVIILMSFAYPIKSLMMGYASSYNYPGGEALEFVNSYIEQRPHEHVLVHMDVAPCMTGINKFVELHSPNVTFDKTEDKPDLLRIWNQVDIAITAEKIDPKAKGKKLVYQPANWKLLHASPAFSTISVRPIISMIKNKSEALALIKDTIQDPSNSVRKLLRSMIVLEDGIFVYERVAKDNLEGII